MLTKAISLKPDYVYAHYNRGIVYAKLGKFQRAIARRPFQEPRAWAGLDCPLIILRRFRGLDDLLFFRVIAKVGAAVIHRARATLRVEHET